MSILPKWLPPALNLVNHFKNNKTKLIEGAHVQYVNDFRMNPLAKFKGQRVLCDVRMGRQNREEGFWHLVEHDCNQVGQRNLDVRSAEKMPWLKKVLENYNKPEVKQWEIKEKGVLKTYIWLEAYDYVVILKNLKKGYFLVTAYHTGRKHYRKLLQKKYKNRI